MEDLCDLVAGSLSLHPCPLPAYFKVTRDDIEVQEHALIFLNHMDMFLVSLFVQNASDHMGDSELECHVP